MPVSRPLVDPRKDDLLVGRAIAVWLAPMSEPRPADFAFLDDVERARAGGVREAAARARFVAGRVLLRRALSAYGPLAPGDWRLMLDARRKPFLAPEMNPQGLVFSLAHCAGAVGCAIAAGGAVGLDLETAPQGPLAPLIDQIAAPAERAGAGSPETFLALWTLKEAYAKARGFGFTRDPREFVFDLSREPLGFFDAGDAQAGDWRFLRRRLGTAALALAYQGERSVSFPALDQI